MEAWDLGRYRDKGNEKEVESLGFSRAGQEPREP